jgi:hypothetical protein
MLMMTPLLPAVIMRSAASRPQRNTPVRFTSMTACHCAKAHLAYHRAVLRLDEQRIPNDAGVVDQDVEASEVFDDGLHCAGDVFFLRDTRQVGARRDAKSGALLARFFECFLVEVQQRDVCAVTCEGEGDCAANAARGAGDDGGLGLQLHLEEALAGDLQTQDCRITTAASTGARAPPSTSETQGAFATAVALGLLMLSAVALLRLAS